VRAQSAGIHKAFGLKGRFYQPRPKAWETPAEKIHDPERVIHRKTPPVEWPFQGHQSFRDLHRPRPKAWETRAEKIHDPERVLHRKTSPGEWPLQGHQSFRDLQRPRPSAWADRNGLSGRRRKRPSRGTPAEKIHDPVRVLHRKTTPGEWPLQGRQSFRDLQRPRPSAWADRNGLSGRGRKMALPLRSGLLTKRERKCRIFPLVPFLRRCHRPDGENHQVIGIPPEPRFFCI
jgi:hypothetical protein